MNPMRNPRRPVRLAVLGTGEWTRRFHLPAMAALRSEGAVEVAGLWNRTVATAEAAAREFGVASVYPTLDAALADPAVDGFVILVHSAVAAAVALRVAERGLPILIEKPPGTSYAEATMLAERIVVPNVVGFNRRFMPLARKFQTIVSGIEKPFFAECHFYRHDRRYPRFVLETGIHGVNYLEQVCGPIASISVDRRTVGGEGGYAWVCPVVFESGMSGLFKFFPCSGSSVERYEVHGHERSAFFDCPAAYTSDQPGRIVVHECGQVATQIVDEDTGMGELSTSGILDEYRDYLRLFDDPSHVSASNFLNACNSMRIAEAIQAAHDGAAAGSSIAAIEARVVAPMETHA
jgi:predicted dehydrogenase